MRTFCRASVAIVLGLLALSAGTISLEAKEIDRRALDIYLRVAFADTEQLVKFANGPSISIYCGAEICRPVAKRLSQLLRNTKVVGNEADGSDANIEILLYSDVDELAKSQHKYYAKPDEKVFTLAHPDCALVQSRRGAEVVKVIIAAPTASGATENLVCTLNEVLRGAGLSVQGRYPDYLQAYLKLDSSQLAVALNGFSLLIAMHSLEVTHPGQDKTTVEEALKEKFSIDN